MRLFARKRDRNEHNSKKLQELKQPIARCVAEDQDAVTKRATAKQAGGFWPVLHLAIGAKVRLGRNLWTNAGLYNGSIGTIKEIIYAPNTKPPALPAVVLIEFPKYKGPNLEFKGETLNKTIPIVPQDAIFAFGGKNRCRTQLPIQLAWGTTIHSSQGLTLEGAWIDLGKNEYASGLTFVALSRVKNFNNCIIESMSFERLQKCNKKKDIADRLTEEKRLLEVETLNDNEMIEDVEKTNKSFESSDCSKNVRQDSQTISEHPSDQEIFDEMTVEIRGEIIDIEEKKCRNNNHNSVQPSSEQIIDEFLLKYNIDPSKYNSDDDDNDMDVD